MWHFRFSERAVGLDPVITGDGRRGKDGTDSRSLPRQNQWRWSRMEWTWLSEERAESHVMPR